MVYSLFFFIRDLTDADLVGWIDDSFAAATVGAKRAGRMQRALIDPLRNVYGVSDKVLNMTLADILLAAPASKPVWLQTGASMIAIDSLVHAFLSRAGILRGLGLEHTYGPACYSANGCADVIRMVSLRIDASKFGASYPRYFPRFVQQAIWRWCAQLELNICNGNNIDDRFRCENKTCVLHGRCGRIALHQTSHPH